VNIATQKMLENIGQIPTFHCLNDCERVLKATLNVHREIGTPITSLTSAETAFRGNSVKLGDGNTVKTGLHIHKSLLEA